MKKILFHICTVLILCIMNAEGAMNTPEVIKLSDVKVGQIGGEGEESEENDPVPIVLWSAKGPASVLQYNQKVEGILGKVHLKQKLRKIYGDGATGFGSVTDAYPISVTSKSPSYTDWKYSDKIEPQQIITADINGDGTDELILLRHQGSVNVYTTRKEIFHDKPLAARNGLYSYDLESSHKATLKSGDVVYLAIHRVFTPDDDTTEAETKRDAELDHGAVVRIDAQGIKPVKLTGMPWRVGRVMSVGTINLPGSENIDELAVVSCPVDRYSDVFLSRHRADGTLIDEPRKFYVPIGTGVTWTFAFTPHSTQLFFYNPLDRQYLFVSPHKKANWLRKADLEKDAGVDKGRTKYMGVIKQENGLVFLAQSNYEFYAMDEESRFYSWQNNKLVAGKEHVKKALFTFKQESPLHELIAVVPANQNSDEFVIVQSRKPQAKKLTREEMIKAGELFLTDRAQSDCQINRILEFDHLARERSKDIAKEKGLDIKIESLDDIKKILPDLYTWLVEIAERRYMNCLETHMLWPITQDDYPLAKIEESASYKQKKEYVKWLENTYLSGEVIISSVGLRGNEIGKQTIADYSLLDIAANSEFMHGPVAHQGKSEHGNAVMTLQKRTLREIVNPAYYLIRW